ncbi:hypothetical protein AB0B45_36145 [Nonomuraea sp. NPDC049152]|uniref:hypothetical protein n=1 Tax=Nonomuraea sp. NPDC049152 TaxID=3154350 RepID=UPI0033F6429F
MLAVKIEFFTGAAEAEFRAEMFTEAGAIADDVVTSFEAAYLSVVEAVLTDSAEELDLLDVALPACDAAGLLIAAVAGIAQEKAEPAALHARVRQLAELAIRDLTSGPAPTG